MSDLYWLTDEQMARLAPYFPKSHGKPRVDDRRVLSGIIFVNRNGLRWRDAPREYGRVWPDDGRPVRPEGRTSDTHDRRDLSQGSPHGFQPWGKKGDLGRLIGRTKGGMNTKLHAITDAKGRPLSFFITACQVSDYTGAAALLDDLPKAQRATFGYRPGAGQGKAFLERIMQAAHIPGLGDAIASLLSVRAELVEQIKEMDRRLRVIASQSQACEILMTIPGVGVQTSAAFAAAVDEAGRFRQSRNAGAYFGLVPRRHQSGELDWTGRITKQGDSTVRKLLYEAANSILTRSRETFALKTWAMKIAKRRGLKKARVALARRLAVIMHAMLRDGTLFQA